MRLFEKILKKLKRAPSEEVLELAPEEEVPQEKVTVRIEKFGGIADVQRIARFVSKGNIVILKTKDLQRKDLGQFQAGVQKLKRVCTERGWGIVGTSEGYIIVTPRFAKIKR